MVSLSVYVYCQLFHMHHSSGSRSKLTIQNGRILVAPGGTVKFFSTSFFILYGSYGKIFLESLHTCQQAPEHTSIMFGIIGTTEYLMLCFSRESLIVVTLVID